MKPSEFDKELIPPDYTGHPEEDDDDDDDDTLLDLDDEDDDFDEDEARIEKLLDEQETQYKNEKEEKINMSNNNPFSNNNTPIWGTGSTSQPTSSKAPWETTPPPAKPTWGSGSGSSWGTGSSWGSSGGWNPGQSNSSPWSQGQIRTNNTPPNNTVTTVKRKKVVICDVLDCLYESWESNGRPNILPRAIFDLKPKFDVWDKVASFNPQKIYIIFPAGELVPSFGNKDAAAVSLEYIAQSLSTYLRIPRRNCTILQQMQQGIPKSKTLFGALKDWKNKDDMVYIGICSGRWGLSERDKDAAHEIGIDYIDMYNLLEGRYECE